MAGVGPLLGSWQLSVVLMVTIAVFYILLTVYAWSVPAHVVANIAGLAIFWISWVLLLANTATCLWNRWRRTARLISGDALFGPAQTVRTIDLRGDAEATDVAAEMRRLGFRVFDDGVPRGVRRRWSALGSYFFHGAFFVVALGFLLSIGSRGEAKLWVAAGEEFTGDDAQFLSRSEPRPLASGFKIPSFRVDAIRPEFFRDILLFTKLEADLTMTGAGTRTTTRINRPLWYGFGSFLRLSGFGFAPRYEFLGPDGAPVETAFVKMNVFPPGQRDFLIPERLPYRVYVELYPDAVIEGENVVNRTLNLREPLLVTTVYRGRFPVASGTLRPGEALDVEGLQLRFPEIRQWGELTVVRDAGVPVIFFGFLLAVAGLAMKLPGRREEIAWAAAAGGRGGRLEVRGAAPAEAAR
jgi:cytochrome c biogenesis protein ResB